MRSSLPPVCRYHVFIGVGLTALALSLFTISCASNRKQPAAAAPDMSRAKKSEGHPRTTSIEIRILEEYKRWKGTRHQLGGTGTGGIDCSGFVKAVYQDAFNINLPRTTKAQVRQGKPVALSDLQPGDLVFFTPPNYPRHVGIFLNRSQFVHASKTKGVTISKIDEHYWRRYFWTARRILPAH
ncbi:MAG: NlpC/P60 family protein [Desulfobacterales bacterium]|jgi:cell wall-associated NlpC family hydrolase